VLIGNDEKLLIAAKEMYINQSTLNSDSEEDQIAKNINHFSSFLNIDIRRDHLAE